MRKLTYLAVTAVLLFPAASWAVEDGGISGVYVEARSAQVFIGGCIKSSEAQTMGREAVLAWQIEAGQIGGVTVGGLAVVAAIAGDENLALRPEAPRRTVLYVDARAGQEERETLGRFFTARHAGLFGTVVAVRPAAIEFAATAEGYRVEVNQRVQLEARRLPAEHTDIVGCGQAEWYQPFVALESAAVATALAHAFNGSELGARWSDPGKQSAYFGRFAL